MVNPKAISLFCGAGGCSFGFKKAGYDVVYASDIDSKAIETYQTNFPNTFAEERDIATLDCSKLLNELSIRKGELDILIGGPPCQGFSTAGTRFWDDPRNQLLKEYVRCLEELQPKWFLMENVEGLLTTKNGEYLFEATKAFIELGYNVRIDKIYAHEYGVPQRRKRVFIVGNRLGLDFELPTPLNLASGKIYKNSSVTLNDAFINLPKPSMEVSSSLKYDLVEYSDLFKYFESKQGQISDHFHVPINGIQLERIKSLNPGNTMKDLPEHLQHESYKKRAFRRVMDGTPSEKRGGAPSGLKRLFGNQPCLTITSAATREFIHPFEDRTLTIRECARIQTFPDYFEFRGNQSQKIQQIGNAIPPLLAHVFAEHIKKRYGFEEIKNEDSGKLIGFSLSKASAMSPALQKTKRKLNQLKHTQLAEQLDLF
ncbi:MAG: DNA cytosine methyltransferase [Cyclobacteriaceae bacterium]